MPALTHLVSLDRPAGVELQFAEFVSAAHRRQPRWVHHLMNPGPSVHPTVRGYLSGSLQQEIPAKHAGRIKLPMFLRSTYCRRRLARAGTDLVMIWNRSARLDFVLKAAGAQRCIHYEHGAAWFEGRLRERRRYFSNVPLAIANSYAAERVLRLMWQFNGPIEVCRNALRPSLVPAEPVFKAFPSGRAVRIGVVSRLFPVKAVAVAIHTLRLLKGASMDVELHVAGEGPERARLAALSRSLGVEKSVRFHGALTAMASFYRNVDCLVHVPISEAFGLVAIEAAAYGCPVIAARVDGLPEAVRDGHSGTCLQPELSISEYVRLGGSPSELPAFVYDPATNDLTAPRIVAPETVAAAVVDLLADPHRFEAASREASATIARDYAFDDYVDAVMAVVDRHFRSREPRC